MHKIGVVGNGRVARYILSAFSRHVKIEWIAGRSPAKVIDLAKSLDVTPFSLEESTFPRVDLIFCAVSDQAITQVTSVLKNKVPKNTPILHTAGAQPSDLIDDYFSFRGVSYPLQTFNERDNTYDAEIPWIIDIQDKPLADQVVELAKKISQTVVTLNFEDRRILHLAAVIINNFTNHLAAKSFQLLKYHQLDPQLLFPLLKKTTNMIMTGYPEFLQTGPAIRNDLITLDTHRNILKNDPVTLELYNLMTKSIQADH